MKTGISVYTLPFNCDAGIISPAAPLVWSRYDDRSGGHFSRDPDRSAVALTELIADRDTRCKVIAYLQINGIDHGKTRSVNEWITYYQRSREYDATHGAGDQYYYEFMIKLLNDRAGFVAWCRVNLPRLIVDTVNTNR